MYVGSVYFVNFEVLKSLIPEFPLNLQPNYLAMFLAISTNHRNEEKFEFEISI